MLWQGERERKNSRQHIDTDKQWTRRRGKIEKKEKKKEIERERYDNDDDEDDNS